MFYIKLFKHFQNQMSVQRQSGARWSLYISIYIYIYIYMYWHIQVDGAWIIYQLSVIVPIQLIKDMYTYGFSELLKFQFWKF